MHVEGNFSEIDFSEKKKEKRKKEKAMSTTVCMVLYHLCITVECYMCIYVEYLWRETQEMDDCGLPVGKGTQELDCGGVKSYLFFF